MSINLEIKDSNRKSSFYFTEDRGYLREWPINLEIKKNGNIYYTPLFSNYPGGPGCNALKQSTIGFTPPENILKRLELNKNNDFYLFPYSTSLYYQGPGVDVGTYESSFSFIANNKFSITFFSGAGTNSEAGQAVHWKSDWVQTGTNYYNEPIFGWGPPYKDKEYIASKPGQTGNCLHGSLTLSFLRFNKKIKYNFTLPGGAGGKAVDHEVKEGKKGKQFSIGARETCLISCTITKRDADASGTPSVSIEGEEGAIRNLARDYYRTDFSDNSGSTNSYAEVYQYTDFSYVWNNER